MFVAIAGTLAYLSTKIDENHKPLKWLFLIISILVMLIGTHTTKFIVDESGINATTIDKINNATSGLYLTLIYVFWITLFYCIIYFFYTTAMYLKGLKR